MHSTDPWGIYLELSRTERLSEVEIELGQRIQFTELVEHAMGYVPYYTRVFGEAGISPLHPIVEFPILSRADLRSHFDELTPRRLPPGMAMSSRVLCSSGTTGEPVEVRLTTAQQAWPLAQTMRYMDWAGLRQKRRFAAIRWIDSTSMTPAERDQIMQGVELPMWEGTMGGIIETGPGYMMSIEQDPVVQFAWLEAIEPNYLLTYPTNLLQLASVARASRRYIHSLKKIITISEPLEESAREEIEEALEADVFDVYSCQELGCIASQCKCGLYHVHAENVIVEVLDDDGHPCCAGEEGRVVLTGLNTFATPLIRYDIGDRATVPHHPVDCDRVNGLPSLVSIGGRAIPSFLLPDGTRKSAMDVAVRVRRLGDGLVRQFSVQQTSQTTVDVEVVPEPGLDTVRFDDAVKRSLWEFFGSTSVHVTLVYSSRLPLTAAGKSPPTLSTRV